MKAGKNGDDSTIYIPPLDCILCLALIDPTTSKTARGLFDTSYHTSLLSENRLMENKGPGNATQSTENIKSFE